MARKTKVEAEKTYYSLLIAATQVFDKQGVSNTTLNDIAKKAGTTRGAVYWHFENKEAVIKALWKEYADVEINRFMVMVEELPVIEPLGHFKMQMSSILKRAFTDPKFSQSMRIIHSSKEFTEVESELQGFFRERREQIYRSIYTAVSFLQKEKALNPALKTEFIANGLWVFLTGFLETHLEMENLDIVSQVDSYVDLFIDAFTIGG